MRVYGSIITIIAVLAIAGAGYLYWQNTTLQTNLDSAKKNQSEAEQNLATLKSQIKNYSNVMTIWSDTFSKDSASLTPDDLVKLSNAITATGDKALETAWTNFQKEGSGNAEMFAFFAAFSQGLAKTVK